MAQIFLNNVYSHLPATLLATTTSSFAVTPGTGADFPDPIVDEFFLVTLVGYDENMVEDKWEIIEVYSRDGDTFDSIARGTQGTTALEWPAGTRVEMRLTALTCTGWESIADSKLGYSGGLLNGDLQTNKKLEFRDTGFAEVHKYHVSQGGGSLNFWYENWAGNFGLSVMSMMDNGDVTINNGDLEVVYGDFIALGGRSSFQTTDETYLVLSLSATTDIDLAQAQNFNISSLTMNTTLTFSNAPSAVAFGFILKVTGGNYTITWPTILWPGGTAPDTPQSGDIATYAFYTLNGGSVWFGYILGEDHSSS